jgi:hypothetical protein
VQSGFNDGVSELVAAFEDADPGFLGKVFGEFAAPGQVDDVAIFTRTGSAEWENSKVRTSP